MILVTGVTGQTGSEVLRRLAGKGVAARGLARNPDKAAALAALPGVEIVAGDMADPATLGAALAGVDRALLISSSDAGMQTAQFNFIDAAKEAGVRHMVKLSGMMPERDSPFRFARMHGEIEKHLEESGLAWTHLRGGEFYPSYFRQVRSILADGTLRLPMAEARIASLDIGDVAEVAAVVLTSAGHEGQIYPLTGPEALSMAGVAEKLSAATGRSIRYVNITPEAHMAAMLANGLPPYNVDALFELFGERRRGKEAQVSRVIPDVFGWTPISFDQFAERNAAIFRGEQPARKG